jgi:hypothetical protein
MTQEAGNPLRESLNRIDREQKRIAWLTFGLLLMMCVQWGAMILAPDDHKGIPWGLSAVITSVFVAWIMTVRVLNANTRAILKAIELLSGQNQKG